MSASGGLGLLASFFSQQPLPGKTLSGTLHELMFWIFLVTIIGALGESLVQYRRRMLGWSRIRGTVEGIEVFGSSEAICELALDRLIHAWDLKAWLNEEVKVAADCISKEARLMIWETSSGADSLSAFLPLTVWFSCRHESNRCFLQVLSHRAFLPTTPPGAPSSFSGCR